MLRRVGAIVFGMWSAIAVAQSVPGSADVAPPEFLERIPLLAPTDPGGAARSFEALELLLPDARVDDAAGVTLSGASAAEHAYLIDGLAVDDPGSGVNGTPLSVAFLDDVRVNARGYLPEFGRASGAVITARTKMGTNALRGSLWGTLAPGIASGQPSTPFHAGSAVSTQTSLWNAGDFGVELGGPIVTDTLFFYGGFAPNLTRYRVARRLEAEQVGVGGALFPDAYGFPQTDPIRGTDQAVFADQRSFQYVGSLSWRISANHELSLTAFGTPTNSGDSGALDVDSRTGLPRVSQLDGELGALGYRTTSDAFDGVLRLRSTFLDQRAVLESSVGLHRQRFAMLPTDGSRLGSADGLAGLPHATYARTQPYPHGAVELFDPSGPGFPSVESSCDPADPANVTSDGGSRCPVRSWAVGGPGLLQESALSRVQARIVGTYLSTVLGHQALKAGADVERTELSSTRAYSGLVELQERPDGSAFAGVADFGSLDSTGHLRLQPSVSGTVSAVNAGAFVQDSWSLADRVTVDVGVRWDGQFVTGTDGAQALAMPAAFSPRVGLLYDVNQDGHTKVFASYARYVDVLPLELAWRGFGDVSSVVYSADEGCDPRAEAGSPALAACTEVAGDRSGTDTPPTVAQSARRFQVDPALQPRSTDELVAGGAMELMEDGWLSLTFVHRSLQRDVLPVSEDRGASVTLANPGFGAASGVAKAQREYDAVTASFDKRFGDGWLARASYTWSRLAGNDDGSATAFVLPDGFGNATGPLPSDRTHLVKAYVAKDFVVSPRNLASGGLAYVGESGTPISYLGADPVFGQQAVFLLPRGAAGRTPWVNRIDARVSWVWTATPANVLTVDLDVFNIFDFHTPIAVDQQYTDEAIQPIAGGDETDLAARAHVNPNFKAPLQFQAPRTVRLGARLTF